MKTFKGLWNEPDAVCCTVFSQDLPGASKGNYEKSQTGYLASETKFKTWDLKDIKRKCQPLHCHFPNFVKWVMPVLIITLILHT
jgi:hypothetical protein